MQKDPIVWSSDDVPASTRFDDRFYSGAAGLEEARYVYLGGNRLRERLGHGFAIAELGFGTGLNALCVWGLWDELGLRGRFRFTSFEAFPMSGADLARAHGLFPELRDKAEALRRVWTGRACEVQLGPMDLEVVVGDARDTVPMWTGQADAWFLDGFAPSKNPEMWEQGLLDAVVARLRPGGTLATFTAASGVRKRLEQAGVTVTRPKGFGRKRQMIVGHL